MRLILIGIIGASALALTACVSLDYDGFDSGSTDTAVLRQVSALTCPLAEGFLTRTAQSTDGGTCDYSDNAGETVHLKLVSLQGRSIGEAMAPTKAKLQSLAPISRPPAPFPSNDGASEHTRIDMPFFHVHTAGDSSDVTILGVAIHSRGKDADIATRRGGAHTIVHSSPNGAEVMVEDVGRRNASLVYVLTTKAREPSEFSAVGYVAKGPAAGPIVVGEFRVRRQSSRDGSHDDLSRLIDLNVKGG